MKLVNTTLTHEIWESQYEGKAVRFTKNIFTNELSVNAHDFAQVIGYKSLDDMMMDDNVLDACNEIKEETGVFPITKQVL
jgi:hypothetical protein